MPKFSLFQIFAKRKDREKNKKFNAISNKNIKNILLIGRTGRGKSTLANVLTETKNFEESDKSISKTKKVQREGFWDQEKNNRYFIIDTPGIGDTQLKQSEVLDIIAEAVYLVRDGVSQVFFVTNGRFDQNEMATYNLLRTIIFDQDVAEHTTIVRTNFKKFRSPKLCTSDIDSMVSETKEKKRQLEAEIVRKEKKMDELSSDSEEERKKLFEKIEKLRRELRVNNLTEIVESCQGRIVYIDNPPLNIVAADDEDEREKESREILINSNKESRRESRKIILNHLQKFCQKKKDYRPEKLKKLSTKVIVFMEEKIKLKEELENLKKEETKLTRSLSLRTEINKNKSINISTKSDGKKSAASQQQVPTSNQVFATTKTDGTSVENKKRVQLEISIKKIEGERERIRRQIWVKERVIRQEVLKHILNNYDDIDREVGGNFFVNAVINDNNDWSNISQEFNNKKLVLEWQSQGFSYQQTKCWADVLKEKFNPEGASFYGWLKNIKQKTVEEIKGLYEGGIEQWKIDYHNWLEKQTNVLERYDNWLSKEEANFDYQQAQEWLDQNYPLEDRSSVTELIISHKGVSGSLDLRDFTSLEWLKCSNNYLSTLDLSGCLRLKVLSCSSNKINSLDLTNLNHLEMLDCRNNYLTELDYSSLDPNKLTELVISDNNFYEQDLSVISKFVNLKYLWIGSTNKEKIKDHIYNRFTGSLWSLKNLRKLWSLNISNTDIDDGFEYLPTSIKRIYCSAEERPESKVKKIVEQLNNSYSFLLANVLIDEYKGRYVSTKTEAAQEWLDNNYSPEQRVGIKRIDIDQGNLEGPLSLEGFANLKKLNCWDNNITNLNISSCPMVKELSCDSNQITELNINHCFYLVELTCYESRLTDLDLSQCSRLKILDCTNNQLTNLDVSSCPELAVMSCGGNQLTDLDCSNLLQLTELYCSQNQLTSLDLRNNDGLVKLECANNKIINLIVNHCKNLELLLCHDNQLNNLDCGNLPRLVTLSCFNNELTQLSLSGCIKLKLLNCFKNELAWLDLVDCQQLTEFRCSENQLTELLLPTASNLEKLVCWENLLTKLDFSALDPEKLTVLGLQNNNFSEQNLNYFANFIQLEGLYVGTTKNERIQKGICDRWVGSLESLKNLTKLEKLDISNTDINKGVEYLPDSIKEIFCSIENRPESKVKEIKWQLDLFISKKQTNWTDLGFALGEIKSWIETGLSANDYEMAYNWKDYEFTPQQVDDWRRVGLTLEDCEFAAYLKENDCTPELFADNVEVWEEKYVNEIGNWKFIHPDFGKKVPSGETYQQEWEKKGFDYREVKQWIEVGLYPWDADNAFQWKSNDFTPQETKGWIEAGLKASWYEFAIYAKNHGHTSTTANLVESAKEFYVAQKYLDWRYPLERRETITNLDISDRDLTGSLTVSNWPNLEEIKCEGNKLSSLVINNLPKLFKILVNNNQLSNFFIKACPEIRELNIENNFLTRLEFLNELDPEKLNTLFITNNQFSAQDLSIFSKFNNLVVLGVGNVVETSNFFGNLESLQNLEGLWGLAILNVKVDGGLEFLSESLEKIACMGETIEELKGYEKDKYEDGSIIFDYSKWRKENIINDWQDIHSSFSPELKDKWRKKGFGYLQTRDWINIGLRPDDADFAYWLKNQEHTPKVVENSNIRELWKKYANAQRWLESNYLPTQRAETVRLNIDNKSLIGSLIITNWPKLERINCSNNLLTSLELNNLPNLTAIECKDNENLVNLTISNCPGVKFLDIQNSSLTNPHFLINCNPKNLTELVLNKKLRKELKKYQNLYEVQVDNIVLLKRWQEAQQSRSKKFLPSQNEEIDGEEGQLIQAAQIEASDYLKQVFNTPFWNK